MPARGPGLPWGLSVFAVARRVQPLAASPAPGPGRALEAALAPASGRRRRAPPTRARWQTTRLAPRGTIVALRDYSSLVGAGPLLAVVLFRDDLFRGSIFFERDTELFYLPLLAGTSSRCTAATCRSGCR